MNEVLEPIITAPNFPELLNEINEIWEEEQQKRRAFYKDVTPSVKWEFINGEIVVHSPARNRHLNAVGNLYRVLSSYVIKNKLGKVYQEKALISSTRNDYEPDIVFFPIEIAQHFEEDQWKFPIPDFIVEVLSDSTEDNDRNQKFQDYALHGVKEYWIIDTTAESVEQYGLTDEKAYQLRSKKTIEDHISSLVLPDFKIPILAIFDETSNLETLTAMMENKLEVD
ncbi:MAG: Uma2 family endonuclease [Bacteroidota bacterium]